MAGGWSTASLAATETVLRINAGGGAYTDSKGQVWSADTGYVGGSAALSNAAIANTVDDALYNAQRWQPGNQTPLKYNFNVGNGDYVVRMHFVELYSGNFAAGRRVFDVVAEGQVGLADVDAFARSGEATPYVAEFPVKVSDGQLNLQFNPKVDSPAVAAIELLRVVPDQQPGTTPPASGSKAVIRVNAGGEAYTDSKGQLWSADTGYVGGSVALSNAAIANTVDDALYNAQRWQPGNQTPLKYNFNLNNGDYTVRMHFVELYSGNFAAGRRVFDVLAEGKVAVADVDAYARSGEATPYVAEFPVKVSDGQLNLQFNPKVDSPAVAAIEVLTTMAEPGTTPPPATGSGITREVWTGISGNTLASLTGSANYTRAPNRTSVLTSFKTPTDEADNYGQRVRGYVVPPTSGSYTFWIASDDASELWLSTDENPANKKRIAYLNTWVSPENWTASSTQRSAAVTLQAGKRYYIEALHKEGSGGDHLAVAWQTSGMSRQIIAGAHLQPMGSSGGGNDGGGNDGGGNTGGGGTTQGLTATYFNSVNLTNPVLTRTDASINFNWGNNAPAPGVNADNFSVRWTGQITPAHSSGSRTYTFYTTTDDGVRLWVDGKLLVDRWVNQSPTTVSGTISLEAGRSYDLRMEYYEGTGGAEARLEWAASGISRQAVPTTRLTTPTGTGGGNDGGGNNGGGGDGGGSNPDPTPTPNPNPTPDPDPTPVPVPETTVSLAWDIPLTRVDGKELTMNEIGGYRVKYGTRSGQYNTVITVPNAYTTNYTVKDLRSGSTYYFVVTAFDRNGVESAPSNQMSKTLK